MDTSKDLNTFINTNSSNLDQFEQFLIQEGLKHQLEFIWAVQGLKSESLHLGQIIRTIYKHYFDVIHISDSVKSDVKTKVSAREYSLDIFDQAVEEVWNFLDSVVYKEFLNHVQALEISSNTNNSSLLGLCSSSDTANNPACSATATTTVVAVTAAATTSSATANAAAPTVATTTTINVPSTSQTSTSKTDPVDRGPSTSSTSVTSQIPTPSLQYHASSSSSVPKIPVSNLEPLIEGQELRNQACSSGRTIVGLSTEALIATQKSRSGLEQMPHSISKQKPKFPYLYANYNSYNPVSRQDSEVQSFSSGCLTDSDSVIETKNKARHHRREIHCDKDTLPPFPQPNTRPLRKHCEMDPQDFANVLIRKLQEVKRAREDEEALTSKLNDLELAQAIREKLPLDETKPDDILDKHVSRVWSDVTPDSSRSPPGRREYKRTRATANTAFRPRIYVKDQEHQLPKSKTFPSTAKYDHDSGISITTTSTNDDFITTWLNNSKPSTKSSYLAKAKSKKEISSVVFYPDNNVPFCFKIPASTVSLGLFKEYLPKKGNYRYFFKSVGPSEDVGVVMEEIMKEDAVLPTFEGKIVAQLKDL